jgi:hypothetical protein
VTGSSYTRVARNVQAVKNDKAKGQRHKRPEVWGRDVTKQVLLADQPTDNMEAGRLPHEPNLRASALSGGEGGQVGNSSDKGLGGDEGVGSCW